MNIYNNQQVKITIIFERCKTALKTWSKAVLSKDLEKPKLLYFIHSTASYNSDLIFQIT